MKGWRQEDLARRAHVSRSMTSDAELGRLERVTVGALRRLIEVLDGRLVVEMLWRGAELDRLLDAHHAALAENIARLLRNAGWDVRVEVSFNVYGDRGRYDILAYHAATRILLVVEIKTRLGDVQDTLGRLDVKVRLARNVGRQFGWQPATVTPLLLVAEDATNRRRVAAHPTLFSSFSLRGRAALAWLRRPTQGGTPSGLLAFRKLSSASQRGVITARRVRRHQPPAT